MITVRYPSPEEEPFEEVRAHLTRLSERLFELLPNDKSLSPLERIERLARVVPNSVQISANHLTARTKLNAIRARLCELAPSDEMTPDQVIDWLVDRVKQLVPDPDLRMIERLERIPDDRLRDNGSVPAPGWTLSAAGFNVSPEATGVSPSDNSDDDAQKRK